jgi:hypothetical protein
MRWRKLSVPLRHCMMTALLLALHCACMAAPPAAFDFAVIANLPVDAGQEPAVRNILQAIGRDPKVDFIVHDGALKGAGERCDDDRLQQRYALLNSSLKPLIYVPGANDWVECSSDIAGGYDPLGRLDLIRQIFFSDPTSLGQAPRPIERQSEIAKFRQFRENVRWETEGVVFIALNLPGDNNHYSSAGGRNGEFEDRMVANTYWLDRGLDYARRRASRAIVVFVQGAPDFEPVRRHGSGAFDWLNFNVFGGTNKRDGYREFKQKMFSLSEAFSGPVLLIDSVEGTKAPAFRIDQPLPPPRRGRDSKTLRRNLTQVEISTNVSSPAWLQVHVQRTGKTLFRLSMHSAPVVVQAPLQPAPAQPSSGDEDGSMPSAPTLLPLAPSDQSAPRIPGMTSVPASAVNQ